MGRSFLNFEMAIQIKARVWDGEIFRTIGEAFLVSGTTISYIASGKMYHDAPWPDGSIGELSLDRMIEIKRARKLSLSGQTFNSNPVVSNEKRVEMIARLRELEELEVDEIQPIDWEEIVSILGVTHPLARQGRRDVGMQKAICKLISGIVVGQRSKEVIEKAYRQELERQKRS